MVGFSATAVLSLTGIRGLLDTISCELLAVPIVAFCAVFSSGLKSATGWLLGEVHCDDYVPDFMALSLVSVVATT